MPDYDVQEKRNAHHVNVAIWSNITGRKSFYPCEQYWTLIDSTSNEVDNILESGLIASRTQFHGVNLSSDVCREFSKRTEVQTYAGEWLAVIAAEKPCPKGGLIYLDTITQVNGHRSIEMATRTIESSGKNTLICANFIIENPRKHVTLDVEYFSKHLELPANCTLLEYGYRPEKTSKTQMQTFFIWKG